MECSAPASIGMTNSAAVATGDEVVFTMATVRAPAARADFVAATRSGLRPDCEITMNNASLAGQTEVGFTLTNSSIAATDAVYVTIASGATADSYEVQVDATASGSCRISLHNVTLATSLSEAVVLNFVVIKGVIS